MLSGLRLCWLHKMIIISHFRTCVVWDPRVLLGEVLRGETTQQPTSVDGKV